MSYTPYESVVSGVVVSGLASITAKLGIVGTGGSLCAGSSSANVVCQPNISGGTSAAGSSDLILNKTIVPSGGVLCAGSGTISMMGNVVATGGVVGASSGTASKIGSVVTSGGAVTASSAIVTINGVLLADYLIYDTFNGPDATALTLHSPDTAPQGSSWSADIGSFKLLSNQVVPNSNANNDVTLIDCQQSDHTIWGDYTPSFTDNSNSGGLFQIVRAADGSNFWTVATDASNVYL